MNKLLSAEFGRLVKSMVFKISLLFSAGLGLFCVLMRWLDIKKNPDIYANLGIEYSNADGLIFAGGLYLIFVIAVLVSIFVGIEYSDGTIRNKLIAGHTREHIYFSKLIVCMVADSIIHITYILTVLVFGNLLIGGTTMKATEILLFSIGSVIAMLALTALLLLFVMVLQNKATGTVVCILTMLVMLFAALTIEAKLEEPEYYETCTYVDETGKVIGVDKERNPGYLTKKQRVIYEQLSIILPVCQLYHIIMKNADCFGWMVVYDGITMMVTTGIGIVVFKKRNLR